jgi:single-strand DNA-binding protein
MVRHKTQQKNKTQEEAMGAMNRVFLMGNLTRDPELRKTPSGTAVSDLGLAVNEKYRNKAGAIVESVCFADVVVWGQQAETCGQYLGKGSPVMVEGRLQLDQWKTDSGENRSRLRVRADRIQFLGKPRQDSSHRTTAGQAESDGEPAVAAAGKKGSDHDDLPF